MADVTRNNSTGKNLIVFVLDEEEARLVADHLGHELPFYFKPSDRQRLAEIREVLVSA